MKDAFQQYNRAIHAYKFNHTFLWVNINLFYSKPLKQSLDSYLPVGRHIDMSPEQLVDTREALIEAGRDLMLEKGWTGFSYKDIADQVGIRKASIHHHFPKKEDLGLAIIASWQQMMEGIFRGVESEHANIYERLEALQTAVLNHQDIKHICPAGILDADFMNLPESMQEQTRLMHERRLALYSSWLAEGRKQKTLSFTGDPEDQAIAILSGFQGAMQVERTMQNGTLKRYAAHVLAGLKP